MLKKIFKPTFLKRVLFFILGDIFISIFTIYLSFLLRFNFQIPLEYFAGMKKMMLVLIPLKIGIFYLSKIYFVAWRFFGLNEYKKLIILHIVVYFLFLMIFLSFSSWFNPYPRSVILIDFFLSIFFIGFLRISRRIFLEAKSKKSSKKAVIYGANNKALNLIKSALNNEIDYDLVAILSDDEKMIGTYLSGLYIYPTKELKKLIKQNKIDSLLIAIDPSKQKLNQIINSLDEVKLKEIKIVEYFKDNKPFLQEISIEDLLARKPKDLDKSAIKKFIQDKTILITGGGGSIGSELARQALKFGAKKILLLDHSEYNLYKIDQELDSTKIIPILQSVVDKKILESTFKKYDIDILIHAAAYKHVPLVEENVYEAILNNIIGTKNCIDLAIKYKVKKFVLISTDKAVRPTNVMGATKRVCELYAQNVKSSYTEIVSVRFGNVLGSSGSVIPKFKEQIQKGGPLTVTHPKITRYFMLIPEACQLVLQAASIGTKRELFILDMGEPVKIVDLAKKMILLSGKDIKIVFTGLRKGEKLYEELLINEAEEKTKYDSIMIAKPTIYDIELLNQQIEKLLRAKDQIEVLKEIIPEFKHN